MDGNRNAHGNGFGHLWYMDRTTKSSRTDGATKSHDQLVAEPRVKFECRIDGSTVFIQTWGDAGKLTVDLGPDGLQMSGNVTLIVNGEQQYQGTVPEKPISVAFTNPPIY